MTDPYTFLTTRDAYGPIHVIGDGTGFVSFYRKGGSEFYLTPGELRRLIDTLTEAAKKATK